MASVTPLLPTRVAVQRRCRSRAPAALRAVCSDRTPAPTTGGTSYTGKGKTGVLSFAHKQLGVGQSGDVTFHTAANGAPSTGFVTFRAPGRTTAAAKPTQVDVGALVRYVAATTLQWGLMVGAMWALQQVTSLPALPAWAPKVLVVLFFAVIALKSRIFSPLDNSRPTITKDGKKMSVMNKRIRPSWMPPPLAFPIVWSTIGVLRTVAAVMIWEAVGRQLLVVPLAAYCLHLSIGDTWNTINNVENRLGTAVLGVGFVWASAVTVDYLYYQVSTTAGAVLAPSVLWLTIASCLVYSINQLNGKAGLLPMK